MKPSPRHPQFVVKSATRYIATYAKTACILPYICPVLASPLRAALLSERGKCGSRDVYVLPLHKQFYGNRSESAYKALNFKEVLDAAGVTGDGYTFHSWRHTMRSRLGEAGADMETAKRLLGHTSDAMSLHYDHADHLAEMRAAVEAAAAGK